MNVENNLMQKKLGRYLDLLTIDLPMLLLGLNYLLYNALEIVFAKQIIRIAALALIVAGGIIRRPLIGKKGILFLGVSIMSLFLNGLGAFNLAFLVIFAVCVPDDMDLIFQKAFRISLILVAVLMISLFTGINHNVTNYLASGRVRNGMGFLNPNSAAIFYYSVGCLFLLSRKQVKMVHMLLVLASSFLVHHYTASRTCLMANIVFAALWMLYQMPCDKGKKLLAKGSVLLIDLLFVLNVAAIFFTDELMPLDDFLSWRVTYLKQLVEVSSLRNILLGGAVLEVDNFYHIILFQYGIFIYALLAIVAHCMMKKFADHEQYLLSGFFVSIFLSGLMEGFLIRPELILFLVIWKLIVCEENACFQDYNEQPKVEHVYQKAIGNSDNVRMNGCNK